MENFFIAKYTITKKSIGGTQPEEKIVHKLIRKYLPEGKTA